MKEWHRTVILLALLAIGIAFLFFSGNWQNPLLG